jgi:hypothetical protein
MIRPEALRVITASESENVTENFSLFSKPRMATLNKIAYENAINFSPFISDDSTVALLRTKGSGNAV